MKKLMVCLAAVFAISGLTFNAAMAEGQTAHQKQFGACAHSGKGMKKPEFQKHMKDCMAGHADSATNAAAPAAAPATAAATSKSDARKAQKEKMKSCNKDAGEKKLKGKERKEFMSHCLSA